VNVFSVRRQRSLVGHFWLPVGHAIYCYGVSRAEAREFPIWPAWVFLDQKDAAIVLIDELLRTIFANGIVVLSLTEYESTSEWQKS
jgi:hypothetical protein